MLGKSSSNRRHIASFLSYIEGRRGYHEHIDLTDVDISQTVPPSDGSDASNIVYVERELRNNTMKVLHKSSPAELNKVASD